jgi:hypothetical protein
VKPDNTRIWHNILTDIQKTSMKSFIILLFSSFLITAGYSQITEAYTLPDAFNFDYTLTQTISGKKAGDNALVHYYYSKSGEYAAAEWSKNENKKGNLLIVLTKAGYVVVLNNREKEVTIVNPYKLMMDMMGMLKWIRMDSLMAHMRMNQDSSDFHSTKTGNTKSVNNYTATEYTVAHHHRSGSVWIANVDFPTQSDYFMSMMGTGMMSMMGNRAMGGQMASGDKMASHPLMQAMMQPKTLITEIDMPDSAGNRGLSLHTISLVPTTMKISTSGFTVNDYSNMTMREIFEAEMKKRNN